ncbi:hypothetical protein [Acidithiobacillus sp.]
MEAAPTLFPGKNLRLRRELRQSAPNLGIAPPLRPSTSIETQGGASEKMAWPIKTHAGRRTTGSHRLELLPPQRDRCYGARIRDARKWCNDARFRGQEAQALGRRGQGNVTVGMQDMADLRRGIPCQ